MIAGIFGYSQEDITLLANTLVKADVEKYKKTLFSRGDLVDESKWDSLTNGVIFLDIDDALVDGRRPDNEVSKKLFTWIAVQSGQRQLDLYIPILMEWMDSNHDLSGLGLWKVKLDKRISRMLEIEITQYYPSRFCGKCQKNHDYGTKVYSEHEEYSETKRPENGSFVFFGLEDKRTGEKRLLRLLKKEEEIQIRGPRTVLGYDYDKKNKLGSYAQN